jgi:hypothetical protein
MKVTFCTSSAFGDEPRQMLKIIQRLGFQKNVQPLHNHTEDGNSNVYRKFGWFSTFDAAHTRKPNLYVELQPLKRKDKKLIFYFPFVTSKILSVGAKIILKWSLKK